MLLMRFNLYRVSYFLTKQTVLVFLVLVVPYAAHSPTCFKSSYFEDEGQEMAH
jgi:hypothetical protein